MNAGAEITAKVIDGRAVSRKPRQTYTERVKALQRIEVKPGLAVVIVGDDPASAVYVRNKVNAGRRCWHAFRSASLSPRLQSIRGDRPHPCIECDDRVHGIIVQLPLPGHFDLRRALECVSQDKDVDGFPSVQRRWPRDRRHHFSAVHAVRRSATTGTRGNPHNIVGKPMAMMLLRREATVSICHVKTRDLAKYTILADILVVAAVAQTSFLHQWSRLAQL